MNDATVSAGVTVDVRQRTMGIVVAGCMVAIGLVHVVAGEHVARLFPEWHAALPLREFWPRVLGALIAIAAGLAIAGVRPVAMLRLVAGIIFASVVGIHLPRSIPTGEFGDAWLNVFKWLAMSVGVWLVAGWRKPRDGAGSDQIIARAAPWTLAAFMVGAAVLHVRFAGAVAQYYIPGYIPWRLFWTYFTAAALTAGGVGLLVPPTARLAAQLSSLMIFLWCLTLHIPRTVVAPRDPAEWCGIFESLAFAAILFEIACRHAGRRSDPAP